MKKFLLHLLPALFFGCLARAETTKTVYNPFTGRLDYITALTSSTVPSGSTQYVQITPSAEQSGGFFISSGTIGSNGLLVKSLFTVDNSDVPAGLFANRSSLSFDPTSGAPSVSLRSYDSTNSGSNLLSLLDYSGYGIVRISAAAQGSTTFQVSVTSATSASPLTRYQIGGADGIHSLYDNVSTKIADFALPVSTFSKGVTINDSQNSSGGFLVKTANAANAFQIDPANDTIGFLGAPRSDTAVNISGANKTFTGANIAAFRVGTQLVPSAGSYGALWEVNGYCQGNNGISACYGMNFADLQSGIGSITNEIIINLNEPGGSAVITNQYGLLIRNLSKGANNYPIWTDSGNVTFNTGAAATKGLIIKGNAGQSANLFEAQDNSANILTSVSAAGVVGIGTSTPNIGAYAGTGLTAWGSSVPFVEMIRNSTSSDSLMAIFRAGNTSNSTLCGIGFRSDSTNVAGKIVFQTANTSSVVDRLYIDGNGSVVINGFTSAAVGLTLQGASGQTANMFTVKDTTGSTVASINNQGNISQAIGSTFNTMTTVGVANVQTSATGIGNAADTTDDTLFTYSLSSNSMSTNGRSVRVVASGHFATNVNPKRLKIWFAGTAVTDSGAVTLSNTDWTATAECTRVDSTHVSCVGSFAGSNVAAVVTVTPNLAVSDLTSNVSIIKTTGASTVAGTASDVLGYLQKTWFEN